MTNVYFQVDTWQGSWARATGNGSSFSGTLSVQPLGFHILYAFASDGQEATSTQAGSPMVGAITAYGFMVTPVTFTLQPASQTIASGRSVVFNAFAPGATDYQWNLNGTPILGATDPILEVQGATTANAGRYTCTATGSTGTADSNAVTLTVVTTSTPGYLTNISARGYVGTATERGHARMALR